jgi:hypothetical protein
MIGEAVEFAPPEAVEPPPRPKPAPAPAGAPAKRPPNPVLVTVWGALGNALEAVVAPGLRLLGRLLADRAHSGPTDL